MANSVYSVPNDLSFPLFDINLDLEPEKRFVEPAAHFRNEIISTVDLLLTQIPKPLVKFMDCFYWVWKYTQPIKYKELQGVVAAVNDPKIDQSKAVLINVLYELESWCTSIVAQMKNGTIIHARNLDFDNANQMRAITYRAKFWRNGTELYEGVLFAGNVGVYTGIKKGAFSVSENQRFPNKNPFGLMQNLFMIVAGYEEISWRVRSVLEDCDSYSCAYKALSRKSIDALGYIILAGVNPDEGAIISRNRFYKAHVDKLDSANGKWFLVQTNSDHWKKRVGCKDRCAAATEHLNDISQDNIDIASLRQSVLLRYPNLNDATLYSTQFVPSEGFIDTISVKYPPAETELFASDKEKYTLDKPTARVGDILSFKTIDMSEESPDINAMLDFASYSSTIFEMVSSEL